MTIFKNSIFSAFALGILMSIGSAHAAPDPRRPVKDSATILPAGVVSTIITGGGGSAIGLNGASGDAGVGGVQLPPGWSAVTMQAGPHMDGTAGYPPVAYYSAQLMYPIVQMAYSYDDSYGLFLDTPSVAGCNNGSISPAIYQSQAFTGQTCPGNSYTSDGCQYQMQLKNFPQYNYICERPGTRVVYAPPSGFAGTAIYDITLAMINHFQLPGTAGVSTQDGSATAICHYYGHTDVVPQTSTFQYYGGGVCANMATQYHNGAWSLNNLCYNNIILSMQCY